MFPGCTEIAIWCISATRQSYGNLSLKSLMIWSVDIFQLQINQSPKGFGWQATCNFAPRGCRILVIDIIRSPPEKNQLEALVFLVLFMRFSHFMVHLFVQGKISWCVLLHQLLIAFSNSPYPYPTSLSCCPGTLEQRFVDGQSCRQASEVASLWEESLVYIILCGK